MLFLAEVVSEEITHCGLLGSCVDAFMMRNKMPEGRASGIMARRAELGVLARPLPNVERS